MADTPTPIPGIFDFKGGLLENGKRVITDVVSDIIVNNGDTKTGITGTLSIDGGSVANTAGEISGMLDSPKKIKMNLNFPSPTVTANETNTKINLFGTEINISKGDTGAKGDTGDKGDPGRTPRVTVDPQIEILAPNADATVIDLWSVKYPNISTSGWPTEYNFTDLQEDDIASYKDSENGLIKYKKYTTNEWVEYSFKENGIEPGFDAKWKFSLPGQMPEIAWSGAEATTEHSAYSVDMWRSTASTTFPADWDDAPENQDYYLRIYFPAADNKVLHGTNFQFDGASNDFLTSLTYTASTNAAQKTFTFNGSTFANNSDKIWNAIGSNIKDLINVSTPGSFVSSISWDDSTKKYNITAEEFKDISSTVDFISSINWDSTNQRYTVTGSNLTAQENAQKHLPLNNITWDTTTKTLSTNTLNNNSILVNLNSSDSDEIFKEEWAPYSMRAREDTTQAWKTGDIGYVENGNNRQYFQYQKPWKIINVPQTTMEERSEYEVVDTIVYIYDTDEGHTWWYYNEDEEWEHYTFDYMNIELPGWSREVVNSLDAIINPSMRQTAAFIDLNNLTFTYYRYQGSWIPYNLPSKENSSAPFIKNQIYYTEEDDNIQYYRYLPTITPGITGTLPVANGGTGASTAVLARENLDVYSKDEADEKIIETIKDSIVISPNQPDSTNTAAKIWIRTASN